MSQNKGVPASPSGYSAEPEPSCTVSAVPVSIPNAALLRLAERIDREGHAWALVADFKSGDRRANFLDEARMAAENYMLADVLRARAATLNEGPDK